VKVKDSIYSHRTADADGTVGGTPPADCSAQERLVGLIS
jgi:hypothetical protein